MAEAAARREARQRKIAENAENRMRRIMNLNAKQEAEQSSIAELDSELPKTSECGQQTHAEDELDGLLQASDVQPDEDYLSFDLKMKQPPQKSALYRKLVLLLLGFAIRYMNLVFENAIEIVGIDLSSLHMGTIFVPFLIYEVTEYFVCPPSKEVNMTLNLMLKVNNIHGRGVQLVVDLLNHLLRLLKDMSVYFFAFVFLDMVFAVFKVDDDVV